MRRVSLAAGAVGRGGAVLAGILRAFRAVRPHVRLDVREAPTVDQARALKEGSLDVGLLLHPVVVAGLATGPLLEKPLGVLVPSDGDLAAREEVDLGGLVDRRLVLFPRHTAPEAYDHVLATCRAYGFVPDDVHEAPRQEFGVGLVMAGDAVALTDEPHREPEGVTWRPLAGRPLTLALSTAWRADALTPSIDAYSQVAVETLRSEAGWMPSLAERPMTSFPPRPSSGPLS